MQDHDRGEGACPCTYVCGIGCKDLASEAEATFDNSQIEEEIRAVTFFIRCIIVGFSEVREAEYICLWLGLIERSCLYETRRNVTKYMIESWADGEAHPLEYALYALPGVS